MTALLADPPARVGRSRDDGAATLGEVVTRAWQGLAARGAACPACGSRLEPVHAAGATPVEGRCGGCGARLS